MLTKRHPTAFPRRCFGSRQIVATGGRLNRQRGAFAVMTAALVVVIVGFCGLAIDLGLMYNRKAEVQKIADAIALAAAAQLNGTAGGVTNALTAASDAANELTYGYASGSFTWSNNAIKFGTGPNGSWADAGAASGTPTSMFFVKVDTSQLPDVVPIETTFIRALVPSLATTQISSTAIAGRSTIDITPFGVCAMGDPAHSRAGELVQYGFRRGVSYNLMNLNPDAAAPPANFLINPIAAPGTTGVSLRSKPDIVAPFICTGTMAMPSVTGGAITVEQDFPLGSLYQYLNSRFGSYTAPCTSATAPPDTNVKEYSYLTALTWMVKPPNHQSADTVSTGSKLRTWADLDPVDIPGGTPGEVYGPLWLYAKAVPFSAYVDGVPEPTGGYATFTTGSSDWGTLYGPNPPQFSTTYPTPSPYVAITKTPTGLKGLANRRVLNVPLLQCPVSSGSPAAANVLAIAKFFMTVQATDKELYAEFAGLVQQQSLGGQVELYR